MPIYRDYESRFNLHRLVQFNHSLKFVNTSDVASISSCGTAIKSLTTLSIFSRVKSPRTSTGRILTKGAGGTGYWALQCDTGSFKFLANYSGGVGQWKTVANSRRGNYQDVCVLYTFGNVANDPTFYINGIKQNVLGQEIQPIGTPNTDDNNIYIGNRSGLNAPLNGFEQCTQVYNRHLTDKEIWGLHNNNKELSDCVGHFKMNEGTGSTVEDSTGVSPSATISGASWSTVVPFVKG